MRLIVKEQGKTPRVLETLHPGVIGRTLEVAIAYGPLREEERRALQCALRTSNGLLIEVPFERPLA